MSDTIDDELDDNSVTTQTTVSQVPNQQSKPEPSGSVLGHNKKYEDPFSWLKSLWSTYWRPFLFVLGVTLLVFAALHYSYKNKIFSFCGQIALYVGIFCTLLPICSFYLFKKKIEK
ncbi:hypothetical protein [Oenococcus oeni]|uniref:hypothetical protein n=1 Tax=Oenococcus oeni TaxID=1247 RepID=UPI0010B7E12E|nr:hypothetical protein [Oenococcus oeni]SYW16183.1 hypothetical protein OENI_30015 [Oenococcus oeni]